ncbi:MAG: gamma-glutamylcyclotransferase family protein, partial [Bacillota bacterium]|nr:gamma-glutamylcyclotransferase family protein [Bacillota bacterium]
EAHRLYFAYGSNLDIDQMYSRCPNSHFLARARLNDYKLSFPRFGSSRGGGVAGLESAEGNSVWGALYFVSDQDFSKLDTHEGAPSCYKRDEVGVIIVNLGESRAITYQAIPQIGVHRPTKAYLGQIIQGARSLEINEAYCQTLEGISVAD